MTPRWQLPSDWRSAPVKHAVRLNSEVLPETTSPETEIEYVDISALDVGSAVELASKVLTFGDAPSRARRVIRSGDTIVSTVRTYLKAVATFPVVEGNLVASTGFAVLRPNGTLLPRFAYWAVLSETFVEAVVARSEGVSYPAISPSVLGALHLPVPPLAEQQRIANFLDEQTARIDALIAEKERLLELLAEHRLSVAERVVADEGKGGQAKIGLFVDLLPGFAFPSDEFSRNPEDVPLLRGINVAPGALRWEETVYWRRDYDPALERFRLRTNDVVFGMDRPWISSGARAAMIGPPDEGALLLQRVCRLRGGGKLSQRFIYYALASDMFRQSIEVDLTGVSVPHISPEQILQFKVPVLSLDEQEARCAAADAEGSRIRELEGNTDMLLERLREYRSSLISAAVTGQLDVSAYRLPAAEELATT